MARDPVCNMEVDEKTVPAESEYEGKTYYFCAPGCKKAFDENPLKYSDDEDDCPPGFSSGPGCGCG